ncbi:cysteine desulfurase / selenocysteine lyase [Planctomycetaceae bacterium]|nr:cysteine desulfurase / selenocysteine lyase [Planctomycetaceae bacterium]
MNEVIADCGFRIADYGHTLWFQSAIRNPQSTIDRRKTMNATKTSAALDVSAIRAEFPILARQINGKPLVYLDNAASAQKPNCVIDGLRDFYANEYANIHRAVHELSQQATERYEAARRIVQRFLNAGDSREIIFTRGTTEGLNLVMQSYGRANVKAGDEIVITGLEHHSNIVPWHMLCEEKGAKLNVARINDAGEVPFEEFEKLLTPRVKIAAFAHVSNALGTINPIQRMIAACKQRGIVTVIDGAQAVPHVAVDVQALGCDFYAFSGHKVYGPSGVGALFGRAELLEKMPPWQGGGDMIKSVTFAKTEYAEIPAKFEAGTPSIADGIALGIALEYVMGVGLDKIAAWEHELLLYGTKKLSEIPGLRIVGTAKEKAAVISFVLDKIHATDAAMILDQFGIAVRTGHHCAQPVMDRFKVPATARASFAMYNTKEEIDALVEGLHKVRKMFG